MFFNTFNPFNGFNLFGGVLSGYNPLINYNWNTHYIGSERYLTDSGSSPKYHAKMFTGQGVHFNGVDQGIEHDLVTLGREFSICIGLQNASGWLLGSGLDNIRINSGYTRLSIGGTQYDFQESQINLYNNNEFKVIVFRITDTTVNLYINRVLVVSLDRVDNNQDFSTKWLSKYSTNFGVGLFNNYILVNKALTEQQIEANYQSPETFLYRENGVLKSQFLSQAEIDSVVAYLPMCEKDEYVRDLVSYSETNIPVVSDVDVGWTDNGDGSFSAVDAARWAEATRNLGLTSGYYHVSFEIDSITSGKVQFDNGVDANFRGDAVGSYSGIIYSYGLIKMVASDAISTTATISNLKIDYISSIYPIQNYTNSCRDDAKNLNKGLQTAKLNRDSLGVPYGLSKYLECDGVSYANTNWIPSNSDDWSIELIQYFENDGTFNLNGWYNSSTDRLLLGGNSSGRPTMYVNEGSHNVDTGEGWQLMSVVKSGSNFSLYVNGVFDGNITDIISEAIPFYIGKTNGTESFNVNQSIKLFKVHDKVLTHEEIIKNYTKYVAQGLLT